MSGDPDVAGILNSLRTFRPENSRGNGPFSPKRRESDTASNTSTNILYFLESQNAMPCPVPGSNGNCPHCSSNSTSGTE